MVYLWLKPRSVVGIVCLLLVGYWALLTFVPVPGFGAGDFSEGHNLTNWIDFHYLPFRKWDGDHDPEGILSTFPAVATCLLGVIAGQCLRDPARGEWRKVRLLILAGSVLMVLGFVWGLQFPIIKKIWTSSFVFVAGGWSMVLLGAFYMVADVLKLGRWLQPFVWLGSNALAIYMVSNVVNFGSLSERFVGGDVLGALNGVWGGFGDLSQALVSILLCILLAGFLYRRKVFLRL